MSKTNLPHISQENLYQFITFRTKDSIDDYIKILRQKNISQKQQHYQIDNYLDNSTKGAYLNKDIITLVKNYLQNIEISLCEIIAYTVMPNHIHILLRQHDKLENIMKQIKGGLSRQINKELNTKGTLWQKDYYDKVIRDEKHFQVTYNYIKNNAIKANLKDAQNRFYSIYE